MIKIKLNTHLKIAIGYIVLIVVLGFSGWLLYSNMRSQQNVSEASVIFMRRQNAAEQMIYSMLKVSTAERAVCLGQVEEWGSYNEAVDSARKATAGLRSLVSDPRQQERIDSLQLLLTMKYNNVRLVIAELLNDKSDSLYYNKVKNLHSGHDSLVIRPKTAEIKENKQTVYEVIKTKRGFFARLADAFRKQYADTVSVRQEELGQVTDSVGHTINIADTVADVLSEIKLAENKAKQQHKDIVNRKARNLQMVSMQLAQRMQQLLEDVQGGERRYLQRALDKDLVVRKAAFRKVEMLAALSVVCVVILLLFIYRDMRKERIYRNYLVQAKAETEKLMAQRERLLLTITHDIKAPAASISGFIELLSDQVSGEKAKAWLSNIQSSANHLLNLVTALLNYHQLENGKITATADNFEVRNNSGEVTARVNEKGVLEVNSGLFSGFVKKNKKVITPATIEKYLKPSKAGGYLIFDFALSGSYMEFQGNYLGQTSMPVVLLPFVNTSDSLSADSLKLDDAWTYIGQTIIIKNRADNLTIRVRGGGSIDKNNVTVSSQAFDVGKNQTLFLTCELVTVRGNSYTPHSYKIVWNGVNYG